MKHFAAAAAIATALTLGTAAIGAAQSSHAMNAAPAHGMAATHHTATHRATSRISEAKARHAALGAVAHGRVQSHRLEHQGGKLVYVYHITVPGQHGWEKVTVDATSGAVISNEHQAPTAMTHHVTHTTQTVHHKR
jgi:uncharacterized membrane protein YkoI